MEGRELGYNSEQLRGQWWAMRYRISGESGILGNEESITYGLKWSLIFRIPLSPPDTKMLVADI
jgi:hypothetical protein